MTEPLRLVEKPEPRLNARALLGVIHHGSEEET